MNNVKIGLGFGIFPFGLPDPQTICAYAERAEDLGIDSVWLSDHLVSRQPSLEISTVMALFAARTKRLKMGPSVLTLPARNPVEVAKTYATLDYLSGGRRRVIMAVGLGNDPRDSLAGGVPAEERAARLEEGVEVLRRLWTESHVTHQGRFYRFEDVTIEPKPAGGALDIWIGGRSLPALRRTAKYGDGWFPSFVTPDQFREGMQRLQALASEHGRSIDAREAGVVLLTHVTEDRERAALVRQQVAAAFKTPPEVMAKRAAIGSPGECCERIAEFVAAGCTKFVLFPIVTAEELLSQVDAYGHDIVPRFA